LTFDFTRLRLGLQIGIFEIIAQGSDFPEMTLQNCKSDMTTPLRGYWSLEFVGHSLGYHPGSFWSIYLAPKGLIKPATIPPVKGWSVDNYAVFWSFQVQFLRNLVLESYPFFSKYVA
jgi:hypothetical protein